MLIASYYEDTGVFLYLAPIISAFCFGFVLLVNKGNILSNKYLGFCFTVLGVGMLSAFVYDRYYTYDYGEILRPIDIVMTFLVGVFIMFYLISLMRPILLTRLYIVSYALGAFAISTVLLLSSFLFSNSLAITKWAQIKQNISNPSVSLRLAGIICVVLFMTYVFVFIIRMYIQFKKTVSSNILNNNKFALKQILANMVLFSLLSLINLNRVIDTSIESKVLFNIASMLIIIIIFWLGFNQKVIIINNIEKEDNLITINALSLKGSYTLPATKQAQIKSALLEYFRKDAPYLNPNLTLRDVANVLATNTTYLSQLINREFDMNFYTFVNNFRVDYTIALIEKKDGKMTGDMLYSESGFKSRSVFYKYFREKTGLSPQDYIRKNIVNLYNN